LLLLHGFKMARGIHGLAKFLLEEDEVCKVLREIGEQELTAALKSFNDAEFSANPKREIESALTILRIALERDLDIKTKVAISLIVAAIYRGLSENALRDRFLSQAKSLFHQYIEDLKKGFTFIGGAEEAGKLAMEALFYLQSPATYSLRKELMHKITKTKEEPFGTSLSKRKQQAEETTNRLKLEFSELYDYLAST